MMKSSAALALLLCAPALALYSSSSPVVQINSAKEFKQVTKGDELWLVEFYAPWCGHCKNLAPAWDAAAKALKGVVKVAAVDATVAEDLARKYSIQGFPTIKVFGEKKSSPKDYSGPREAKGIIDFAMKEVKSMVSARAGGKSKSDRSSSSKSKHSGKRSSSAVITGTDDNFDDVVLGTNDVVFVEFYAPWCGHCKALAPEWEDAASQTEGQVKFVAVDATEHSAAASRFGVRGYPTIKVFPGGPKSASSAKDYNGPRTASGLAAAAMKEMEESGVEPELPELTSQDVFDENCSGKRICVIAVLADILDDGGKDGRNKRIEMLKEVMKKQSGRPFRFMWTSVGKQSSLEGVFGSFDAPAVFAVNVDKKVYGMHRGALSTKAVSGFCDKLMRGKGGTDKLSRVPSIATVDPWDGEEGTLEVEEEFSLDDIMNEEL